MLNIDKALTPADRLPALHFDATGDPEFLDSGRRRTLALMTSHVTHAGVHDHGFNNVGTYGNLLRLGSEGAHEASAREKHFFELALKCTGAVQAARWAEVDGGGFIHSFNGTHLLFVDMMRTLRALLAADRLGRSLMAENDREISLHGEPAPGAHYRQAGLTVLRTLLTDPYLSRSHGHQGLLPHSFYHRPNGWDHIPEGRKVPCRESSMWETSSARGGALCAAAGTEPALSLLAGVRFNHDYCRH